ncbi:CDP-diacylglycerol--serine O-phosphatidyltransferase [Alicyclobacillus shizuokensis]|uniref:CDP-diacylglycerol--serine O-phosphatidyltransferase n=1 Tax=Alicyclobacillus shizuokensis TaxID=392014 RepID=UPI00082B886A|nr:CDP-diacylglycerol--serine O-phosphatidyltransferase [Alicyclobacillus shizuokensis]MCL6627303.1 CDP-diacylglycerol--serine O-phosphatidyltransferase [Alicyclobacillus shizuokensis]
MFVKAIPSLLTVGNLIIGFVAMLGAFRGNTAEAALLVIAGMVLDGLDGRAARWLHAESAFGKELDSLSDIVTFGIAPSFIMYQEVLQYLGWVGTLLAVLFPVCGALRLARFNIQARSATCFVGLPITAAGGILATMALYGDIIRYSKVALPIGMLILALLMVSRTRYPNFKRVALPRSAVIVVPLLVGCVYLVFRYHYVGLNRLIFVPLALYAVCGFGYALHRRLHRSRRDADIKPYKPEWK